MALPPQVPAQSRRQSLAGSSSHAPQLFKPLHPRCRRNLADMWCCHWSHLHRRRNHPEPQSHLMPAQSVKTQSLVGRHHRCHRHPPPRFTPHTGAILDTVIGGIVVAHAATIAAPPQVSSAGSARQIPQVSTRAVPPRCQNNPECNRCLYRNRTRHT